jgi:phosphate acetyltransferase
LLKNVSMNSVIEQIYQKATELERTILLPEADDPRIVEAANVLVRKGLAKPILLSPTRAAGLDSAIEVLSERNGELCEEAAQQLYRNRQHKGLSLDGAREAVASDRLILGALLLKIGRADGGVAGSLATTASVLRAGLYGVGTAPGSQVVSSFFLMQLPTGSVVTFADCAVVPDPNPVQLAEIAIASAENHRRLTGDEPRVALLSFSTFGSAEHPRVEKVRAAKQRALELNPQLQIDGELQFDAAFVPQVGKRKAPGSAVAGQANVFIFPDLDSGNIGYKIAERIGGAAAYGPIIQGLQKPWMDLSRGCSVDDIVNVAAIAACMSERT